LGIGPVALTEGTVTGMNSVPTVTDNLYSQKIVTDESIGISYVPSTTSDAVANGELTFGATTPRNSPGMSVTHLSPKRVLQAITGVSTRQFHTATRPL